MSAAQELELVEDVWRGEVQDLLNQISQLQAENRRLTASLPLKDSSIQEEDSLKQEGEWQDCSWEACNFLFFFNSCTSPTVVQYSHLMFLIF